jgi:hypothetical protein
MPHSRNVVSAFLQAVADLRAKQTWDESIRIRFVGTGYYGGESISQLAKMVGLESIVEEQRARIPYQDVLKALAQSACVLLFGSTEAHYTPSKIFQALLSKRPILGALHQQSDGLLLLKDCHANRYIVASDGTNDLSKSFQNCMEDLITAGSWAPHLAPLDAYRVEKSAEKIESAIKKVRSIQANHEQVQ